MSPQTWLTKLKDYFIGYDGALIAYSGGVDSALLAYVAHLAKGKNMLAVLADSPSLARREYRHALDFANDNDIPLYIMETHEIQNPFYGANKGDRCYHCKKALFERIEALRRQPGNPLSNLSWPVFYGVNLDDLGDYRPGIQAANESAILAPYVELKIDKSQIRRICTTLGLEVADKPAMPCLASRIAYGQEVNVEKLKQVEARTKLLVTLSDGKPDDYDTYRGAYGIEDTRMALIEAKRTGIHPFCITIDSEARDYLPHMYGAANYTVISDVEKLPVKISDIYKKITS